MKPRYVINIIQGDKMRFDKFTLKSQELIKNAQSLVNQYGNQQIEPEHLLGAMLTEKESVAVSIMRKLGISPETITRNVNQVIAKLPKISGAADVYLSPRAGSVLEAAFSQAAKMKDEYVSIEHIFIALSEEKEGESARILNQNGITKDNILKVLMDIRGSQRITDPNPEEKYQALDRFSRDLTELARLGKLDPVIGRA